MLVFSGESMLPKKVYIVYISIRKLQQMSTDWARAQQMLTLHGERSLLSKQIAIRPVPGLKLFKSEWTGLEEVGCFCWVRHGAHVIMFVQLQMS